MLCEYRNSKSDSELTESARPEPFATNFTLSANTSAPLLHRIDFSLKHWYMAEDNT